MLQSASLNVQCYAIVGAATGSTTVTWHNLPALNTRNTQPLATSESVCPPRSRFQQKTIPFCHRRLCFNYLIDELTRELKALKAIQQDCKSFI